MKAAGREQRHGRELLREGWGLLVLLLVLAIILGCTLWYTDACGMEPSDNEG